MTDRFHQNYWQTASQLGPLRAVIDPRDTAGDKNRAVHAHHQTQLRLFLAGLPIPAGLPVLDLGCGTARHRALLESHGGPYLGIDRSAGMLAQAPARNGLACGELLHLPVRDRSIGLAFAFWVFQHLIDDWLVQRVARRLRQAIAPRGLLVLTERAGSAPTEPGQDARYIHHRQPDHYVRLLAPAGWSLLTHRVMPAHPQRPGVSAARGATQEIHYAFAAHA